MKLLQAVSPQVDRCVRVPIERQAARPAFEDAFAQSSEAPDLQVQDFAARAELGRREEAVGHDQPRPIPLTLVGDLTTELAEPRVTDRESKAVGSWPCP